MDIIQNKKVIDGIDDKRFPGDTDLVYQYFFETVFRKVNREDINDEILAYSSKFEESVQLKFEEKNFNDFSKSLEVSGIVQYKKQDFVLQACRSKNSTKQKYSIVFPLDHFEEKNVSDESCSLLSLNADCLFLIFSWLTLRDLINLAESFGSIKSWIKLYYEYKKKVKFDSEDLMMLNSMKIHNFFCDNGSVIENVQIINSADILCVFNGANCLRFALRYCSQLKSLHVYNISFFERNDLSIKIADKLKQLKYLKLIECGLKEEDLALLSQINDTVNVLDLSGNNSIKGFDLYKFEHLTEIYLANCEGVDSANFDGINLTNLLALDITGCHRIKDSSFEKIHKEAKNLKLLKLSFEKNNLDNNFEEFVGKMENLRDLTISNTSRLDCLGHYIDVPSMELRLQKLSNSTFLQNNLNAVSLKFYALEDKHLEPLLKFKNLKQIDVAFSYKKPVPEGFCKLVASMEKLETLGLRFDGMTYVRGALIIESVKARQQVSKPFTINAVIHGDTYAEILKHPVYEESKNFIKIVQ